MIRYLSFCPNLVYLGMEYSSLDYSLATRGNEDERRPRFPGPVAETARMLAGAFPKLRWVAIDFKRFKRAEKGIVITRTPGGSYQRNTIVRASETLPTAESCYAEYLKSIKANMRFTQTFE